MKKRKKYPFDMIDYNGGCVSVKLAKALIVKFLKQENTFFEMVTECMHFHPSLKSVDDVLNNMITGTGTPFLVDCLFYSTATFSWERAYKYHIGNADGYWTNLKFKWERIVGDTRIKR